MLNFMARKRAIDEAVSTLCEEAYGIVRAPGIEAVFEPATTSSTSTIPGMITYGKVSV